MGRGQQMSSFGMAEPGVITSGKDFCVMSRRKLVITFAIFMPLLTASSYMYFATPGAPTEFFKGRPLASFMPPTGSTNTTLIDSSANRNGTEVEQSFEGTGNATDSSSKQPVEESFDTEVEPSFKGNGDNTESLNTQPVEESIDAEVEPSFEGTGNNTESLNNQPVEENFVLDMERSFEGTGNTTENLNAQPVDESIDAEVEPNFEGTGNTTDSIRKQPVEESFDADVEPSFESTRNSTENPNTQPVEEIFDAEVEPSFEGTGNTTENQPGRKSFDTGHTTENTTENFSTQPVEESLESDAVVKDEQAKELDPVAVASANNTRPALGIPHQELANLTASDSLMNSTSRNANASIETSQQKIPEDNSSSLLPSEQSIIAMEGQGLSTEASKGSCSLLKGSWVPDSRPPAYTNATCDFILEAQNCLKNGRSDTGYLYWKWQPEQCALPKIQPRVFLNAMRNRSMAFVGDSIARNQFQSLLCLLSQGERPENTYKAPDDRDNVFVFREYNFTMAVYWSPYLVHVDSSEMTLPNNATETRVDVHLDRLDEAMVKRLPGVDILQISTGQWWFKFGYYMLNGQNIGCHTWPGMPECTDIGFTYPYSMAIHSILQGVLSVPGFAGTTIWRSFAPDHFEGGSWSSDGQCVRKEPGGVPISDMSNAMYQVQIQVFQNVTGALSASEKQRLRLLDITNLAQERPDGHPNVYRTPHPFSNKGSEQRIQKDCLHWCLPGPIDTWNELLVEILHDAGYS